MGGTVKPPPLAAEPHGAGIVAEVGTTDVAGGTGGDRSGAVGARLRFLPNSIRGILFLLFQPPPTAFLLCTCRENPEMPLALTDGYLIPMPPILYAVRIED